ncbi:hypothetical protein niasHT_017928 [Heterodera trifolii]|uniref:Uncharacterized protein n=1 Tax=Heterodera trifolii TaxID=157864 RepID=A0ABD2LIU2_9BILA
MKRVEDVPSSSSSATPEEHTTAAAAAASSTIRSCDGALKRQRRQSWDFKSMSHFEDHHLRKQQQQQQESQEAASLMYGEDALIDRAMMEWKLMVKQQ